MHECITFTQQRDDGRRMYTFRTKRKKEKTSKTVTNVLESDVAVVCAAIKGKRGRAPPHPLQRKREKFSNNSSMFLILDTWCWFKDLVLLCVRDDAVELSWRLVWSRSDDEKKPEQQHLFYLCRCSLQRASSLLGRENEDVSYFIYLSCIERERWCRRRRLPMNVDSNKLDKIFKWFALLFLCSQFSWLCSPYLPWQRKLGKIIKLEIIKKNFAMAAQQ